jgi:hypothetical protein
MIDVKDGYELGLLFRVMSNIDIVDYMAAGLDHDTACLLLTPDKFRNFILLGDDDREKAASVIMQRYQPQAERARVRAVA